MLFFHMNMGQQVGPIALRREAPEAWAFGVRNLRQEEGDGASTTL